VRAFFAVLVAANPAAVTAALLSPVRREVMAVAAAGGAVVAVAVAVLSGPLLDALDVTPATFEVAAGVVLGVAGVLWLAIGPWIPPDELCRGAWREAIVPLLVPVLVTPQLVAVSISVGADSGVGVVALGAAVAMVLTWVLTTLRPAPQVWSVASRFVGVAAIALALALAVDGIRTV
jgi:small neutral amino acid transporter SnatA (MarC family)